MSVAVATLCPGRRLLRKAFPRQEGAERAHLEGFFASLKSFESATLHGQAVGDNFSASEWTFKMTAGDGSPIIWHETLVRTWRDGKIVSEKYYTQA